MKRILFIAIIATLTISILFKGLFFQFETYIFFAVLSVLAAAYFTFKAIRRENFAPANFAVYLNGTLLAAYIIAFWGTVSIRGNIETLMQYSMYISVFLVVYDYLSEHKEQILGLVILPLTASVFITSLIGLAGYTGFFPQLADTINGPRIGSTFQYANTAGVFFLLGIVFSITIILHVNNLYLKALMAGVGNIIFFSLTFTGSRGVYIIVPLIMFAALLIVMPNGTKLKCAGYMLTMVLPVFTCIKGFDANSQIKNIISASKWVTLSFGLSIAAALIFGYASKIKLKRKWAYITSGAFLSFIAVSAILFLQQVKNGLVTLINGIIPQVILQRLQDINLTTIGVTIRFQFYADALKLIKAHWLTGIGGGGFAAMYQSVQDTYYTARLVHDHYLQVFTESGILGFLSFTLLTAVTCVYLVLSLLKAKDIKSKICLAGCLCAFSALAVHSALDFNLSFNSIALIYWLLIGVASSVNYEYKENAAEVKAKTALKILRLFPALFILVPVILTASSILFANSAYYAIQGEKYLEGIEFNKSMACYEKASSIDKLNPDYRVELAQLYQWRAGVSKTENEKSQWVIKAEAAGEAAVRLSPYTPYNNFVLANIYFETGKWIKAYNYSNILVRLQPMRKENYELVARGALEAGLQKLREGKASEAKALLQQCIDIDKTGKAQPSSSLDFYRGKALLLLGDFTQSEKLLSSARNGSLELKMDSDRLLYIINEETGRSKENEKYKGVVWMGLVKKTPVYKEVKGILTSGILYKR